jgi:hypothetical protein
MGQTSIRAIGPIFTYLKIFTQTLANIEKFLVSQILNLCVQFRFFLIYRSTLATSILIILFSEKNSFKEKKYFVKEKIESSEVFYFWK